MRELTLIFCPEHLKCYKLGIMIFSYIILFVNDTLGSIFRSNLYCSLPGKKIQLYPSCCCKNNRG